jgi:predicted dehydrogenase
MNSAKGAGMELVAICDTWEEKLLEVGKELGVAQYTDYEKFLEHEMDAVVLANYFHEHAPFAIRALEAGLHVMSECSACKTVGEGVALCRAVEKSKRVYMLAENYPFTAFNIEMRRLYQAGEIGEVLYAEGEYNHPLEEEFLNRISPGMDHWRNWIPPTYYCTHALAPLMMTTDTMPVSVSAMGIAAEGMEMGVRRADPGFASLCRMDNGAVFRLMGLFLPGHSVWYRYHGRRGSMESVRGPGYWGPGQVRVVHEPWDLRRGEVVEKSYVPEFPAWSKAARTSGHGGGDFFTSYYFAEAIRKGEQPYLDVYRGVAMSVVGIQAWRSALEGGTPMEMPDFRREVVRRKWERDQWCPGPGGTVPLSIRGKVEVSARAVENARRVWKGMGYKGE